jgi:hypothetical protein
VYTTKIQHLIGTIKSQFRARTETEGRKHNVNYGISLDITIDACNALWLSFTKDNERHNITVPLPFDKDGVALIQQNEVVRAICPFWLEKTQEEIDYLAAMYYVIMDNPEGLISRGLFKATPYIQQIIYGFKNGNISTIVYRFQKAIDEIVNKMPLHETSMNSYVMNNRLMVVDPEFDALISPADRLNYQVNKSKKYFDKGWTSIGLADGSLADKNYLLKVDLRSLSPFGIRYHNPQRNLYSTLGMKGDDLPNIRSRSMQNLMNSGISRHGWNLFTAFVDIPDVFEDMIVVDKSLLEKSVEYDRRYQVFGKLAVKEGQNIKTGAVLGEAPDQESIIFDTKCDSAKIKRISESVSSIGGVITKVYNIIIDIHRKFKDGFKFTNLHGNKGIIKFVDLGYAVNPITNQRHKIEVIVGAKTVGKRRNYGQIMEALTNCILEADGVQDPLVIEDDWWQPIEQIYNGLERRGYRRDGTWDCDIYAGRVKAICGKVFWGCIKTPEDQVWKEGATTARNGKDVRTAGLKFSHVELRSIETIFGKDNPILDEIMSYVQGSENLHEMLEMVQSKIGTYPKGKPVLDIQSLKPIDQTEGTIVGGQYINGTVVDEYFFPNGFLFRLPIPYQSLVDTDNEIMHEGSPIVFEQFSEEQRAKVKEVYTATHLYFPCGTLRQCWRHDTGKFGLGGIGTIINNVVVMSKRITADPTDPLSHRLYYNSIATYFAQLSKMLGTKRGEIATYAMSIRYPFSVKGEAVLSTTLPKNTIEIHRSMANVLKVTNGDIVLAERFPCLGFMSIRIQKIRITDDPMCEYVIRVSNNDLVSMNLDFDGDVLYLASFHTPEAKSALKREWTNPNKTCYTEIKALNERKGAPHIKEFSLHDFNIKHFDDITCEEHAIIVEKNTGVKAQTGPVIALTYNIMRIVENSDLAKDQKMKVAVEMFLEKAAQSVFEQKHGGKSLYEIVIDGICTSDVEMLVDVGFKRGTTEKLCELVTARANSIGVTNLKAYHEKAKKFGGSNLISAIVKKQNKIYFASRSQMDSIFLLEYLKSPAVDIPSRLYKWVMSGKHKNTHTVLDEMLMEKEINLIRDEHLREACGSLCKVIDNMFTKSTPIKPYNSFEERREYLRKLIMRNT